MGSLNVGIELELEDTSSSFTTPGWRAENDGTLRGSGVEFLLANKQPIPTAKRLTRQLLKAVGDNYSVSHRCSTHIHVDIQGLHGYSKVAMLLGLIVHDDWFFQYGEGRKKNHFCCPVLRTPAALVGINRAIRTPDWDPKTGRQTDGLPVMRDVNFLNETNTKYLSINTMPMNTLGTIELRHFAPVTNPVDMDAILDKITSIYEVAKTVPKAGKKGCIAAWQGFDKNLTEEISWVTAMYDTHNQMVGE